MPIDTEEFKSCLASWASGVTIVTSRDGDDVHGMTVSDFSGASLSPPLVTVCCSKDSITTGMIARGKCFGVNVLAHDQQALSNKFASKKQEHERFVDLDYDQAETGAPLLGGCVVNLDCRLVATYEAGDHVIYLGEIETARRSDRRPLVYFAGGYRELAEVS